MNDLRLGHSIDIDPKYFGSLTVNGSPGMEFKTGVSPYDVPVSVRASWDVSKKIFSIDFRYLDDEPTELMLFGGQIELVTGKNSNRIYKILIRLPLDFAANGGQLNRDGIERALKSSVPETIDAYAERALRNKTTQNPKIAKAVISDKRSQLIASGIAAN